jgi:hypothetical protein
LHTLLGYRDAVPALRMLRYRPLTSNCRNTAALGQQSTFSPLRF